MNTFLNDIKYALRMLRKNPGFTVIALVTLAIGIGANTITFSLLNALFLRPVQVERIEELAVCEAEGVDFHFRYTAYKALREHNPVFREVAAVTPMQPPVTWARTDRAGYARQSAAECVSSNYFSTLGGVPAQGRWFLPEEERYGAEPAVVLSHLAWTRYFEASDMVGSAILLNGVAFRVVGVAPKGFTGATMVGADFWVPLGAYGVLLPKWRANQKEPEAYPNVIPVGRLKPQLPLAAAQGQVQAVVPGLKEKYPQWWPGQGLLKLLPPGRMQLMPYFEEKQRAAASVLMLCLMSVSGVVLVIACLNLASMMNVQGTSRQREIAIRLALGGGRLRIVRQLLIECLLMSLAGGVLGYVLASAGLHAVEAWVGNWIPIEIPSSLMDGRVLLGTLGFCVVATILFGLKPALRLSRRDVITDLKESGCDALRSTHKKQWVPRGLSVVAQTALSFALVMGAALFTRSALNTMNANSNFSFDGKLVVEVDLQAGGYDAQRSRQICETIKNRFLALPGVESVAMSSSGHFTQSRWDGGPVSEYAPGSEQKGSRTKLTRGSQQFSVGIGYIKTLGLSLLQGRAFNELDFRSQGENVIIINEHLAQKIRAHGNALDTWIRWGPDKYIEQQKSYRVVGIVSNVTSGHANEAEPTMYIPMHEKKHPKFVHVLAGSMTRQGQGALVGTLSQEVFKIDSQVPLISVSSLEDHSMQTEDVWLTGLGARLAAIFGAMALFLAALGIYAIKGYMVASRTPEIGTRMALGATRKDIMLLVFRQGSVLTLVGLGCGLIAGLGLAHLMRSLFVNVSPLDPISIGATIVVLALTSALAGVIPALRAARIDPMVALRYE
ncbi:MAG: ABC transporter permease [Phycisphaeraceae bacterium]|nr:ABC transporter permease [Phycisphaeraceae bacterium]